MYVCMYVYIYIYIIYQVQHVIGDTNSHNVERSAGETAREAPPPPAKAQFIWGLEYDFTNYKFKTNLNFEKVNLNVAILAGYA